MGAVVVVLALVAAAGLYLRPIAPIATGYAAKIVCSAHFVADRTVADARRDLPANPLVPLLRFTADDSEGLVRVTLAGLWPSTAYHTTGHGCSLSSTGRPDLPALATEGANPTPWQPWPQGDAVTITDDGVDGGVMDAALAEAFAEDDREGFVRGTRAVVVAHQGRIVAERYADGFDETTPLLGWSMSKSVANALTGMLVARGDVSLDDAGVVPGPDDGRARITIRHLLEMTSGLAFDEGYSVPSDVTQMLFASDDVAARAADEELVADPGTVWSYSSASTNLLCDALRNALGRDAVAFARQALFDPLGMASAVLEPDATGGWVCSSYSYATARDWAKFGQLYLDDGLWNGRRLLPEGWVEYSATPVAIATEQPYGASWWLNAGPDGRLRFPAVPADAFWAQGNEGQQVVVVPSAELVIVRLGLSSGYESSADWGLDRLVAGAVAAVE